jgi:hypothetical protein
MNRWREDVVNPRMSEDANPFLEAADQRHLDALKAHGVRFVDTQEPIRADGAVGASPHTPS